MREVNEKEALLRRFLLDELDEGERQRIEKRFLSDGDFRESVLMAEDNLIDDYLEGGLTAEETRRFLTRYLTTPQQRRKLRIAKSIKQYVAGDVAAAPPTPTDGGTPQDGTMRHTRAKRWLLRNPLISLPLAAALVIVLGLGAMKLIEKRRLNKRQEQEQAARAADEQELAQLNDPSVRGRQAAGTVALSVTLLPVSTRGVGSQKFSQPAGPASVELLLVLEGQEYQSYQLDIQKIGSPERLTVRRLQPQNTSAGRAVPLIVPTRLLARGDYLLRLTGITPAGGSEEAGEYTFHVTGS